ncbi:MAG: selenocysteine-specific translation elongation factor [Acidimicrobiia bacterium]|nr:selenocysteine-specific translation elongation factor [Acidimicrobiia bacterium]
MPIVATAGHVDHGKSTLVAALTGRDPDRWAEEKERGLTIDLGFAWRELDGLDVGFVDVPGHERFIKNMLAGVGAVDVALFVVAADEGWMPQSEEHLAVLDLLDTTCGVIALTRIDLVDADAADLAELEVMEQVEGTALADWPIVRISPATGEGMARLEGALVTQLRAAGAPIDSGRPRLWIDRSFHIAGAGLVVTGTLSGGSLGAGDELMLWPDAKPVRVRGLQHHDASVTALGPGTRAALNLAGIDGAERGMLLTEPDAVSTTTSFLATLRQVRSLDDDLTSRGAFHLHAGTGAWPVQLRILETGTATIRSREPVPLRFGDHFIIRETGRRAVVAGGRVLDPHPPRSGAALRDAARQLREVLDEDPNRVADTLLAIRGTASLDELRRDSGGGSPSTSFVSGTSAMAAGTAAALLDDVVAATTKFHSDNRLRPGIAKAELASTLGVDAEAILLVVAGTENLIDDGRTIRRADFEPGLSPEEATAWQDAEQRLQASLTVPRATQLGLDTELLHALVRDGRLVRIADDLVYLPEQIETITASLRNLPAEFTVAEFRDELGVTRRQAVPLLEWFDTQGVTRRQGDVRILRENRDA